MRLQTKVGLGATWPCESMVPLHPQWNPAHGRPHRFAIGNNMRTLAQNFKLRLRER